MTAWSCRDSPSTKKNTGTDSPKIISLCVDVALMTRLKHDNRRQIQPVSVSDVFTR